MIGIQHLPVETDSIECARASRRFEFAQEGFWEQWNEESGYAFVMTQHITLWQRPKVLPVGRNRAICIDLQPSSVGLLMLSGRDDGVGLPKNFDLQAIRTLGRNWSAL